MRSNSLKSASSAFAFPLQQSFALFVPLFKNLLLTNSDILKRMFNHPCSRCVGVLEKGLHYTLVEAALLEPFYLWLSHGSAHASTSFPRAFWFPACFISYSQRLYRCYMICFVLLLLFFFVVVVVVLFCFTIVSGDDGGDRRPGVTARHVVQGFFQLFLPFVLLDWFWFELDCFLLFVTPSCYSAFIC